MRNLLLSHSPQSSSYPIPLFSFPFPYKNLLAASLNSQILNRAAETDRKSGKLKSPLLHLLYSSLKISSSHTAPSFSRFFIAKMGILSPATFPAAAVSTSALTATMKKKAGVTSIEGLSSYGGLKAQNTVSSVGVSACADKSFAMVMNSIKSSSSPSKKKEKSRGGAFSSTCNAAAEIFKIAAIMNGLVLVGVAFGFILLRVEAIYEESE